ncbi:glycosyltransferase [Peribacillus butanolivorans]|uniref:glycosyltransferase n=1 Tax=Peribacillus butanolivorans TaxID=421767 RepID=UPI003D2B9E75
MCTITLCIIVKNEEEVLNQCLNSVSEICDEIIVVDTGSTDKTKEIASHFTEKVIDFKWIDDFSAARNFASSHATMDYILWLDASDIILEEDLQKLKTLKNNLDGSIDAVSMMYSFDGNLPSNNRRNHLVKREKKFLWVGPVNEFLNVTGNILPANITITHRSSDKSKQSVKSDRNLIIYNNRVKNGEVFTPRDLFYFAKELKIHAQFLRASMYYREFLATKKGSIEDEIRACISIAECYRGMGNLDKEKEFLALSIKYDVPRPEVSCRLGDLNKACGNYKSAIIWYKLALDIEVEDDYQGFMEKAYSPWYPHLHLCVCYWKIGDQERAVEHNNEAKKYRPNDVLVKRNEEFFNNRIKK